MFLLLMLAGIASCLGLVLIDPCCALFYSFLSLSRFGYYLSREATGGWGLDSMAAKGSLVRLFLYLFNRHLFQGHAAPALGSVDAIRLWLTH